MTKEYWSTTIRDAIKSKPNIYYVNQDSELAEQVYYVTVQEIIEEYRSLEAFAVLLP